MDKRKRPVFPYLYETHLHTKEGSACSHNTAEELVHAYKAAGYTGIIVTDHPYREAWYIPEARLFPEVIDGVEVFNASHYGKKPGEDGRTMYDVQALAYADKYNLPYTGGSDIHSTNLLYGGMAFPRKLADIRDYMQAVLAREGKPIDYFEIRRTQDALKQN